MSRYGAAKYGRDKYGAYEIQIEMPISQDTRFRMSTIGTNKLAGRKIVTQAVKFPALSEPKIRIRTDKSKWIRQQKEKIEGQPTAVRIRSVSSTGDFGPWVVSVTGSIKGR